MGMDPDTALQLAAQTFVGAGRMLQEVKRTPQELIDQVVSPGGTTQAGLEKMAELGCDDAYRAVIRRASERSIELSKL